MSRRLALFAFGLAALTLVPHSARADGRCDPPRGGARWSFSISIGKPFLSECRPPARPLAVVKRTVRRGPSWGRCDLRRDRGGRRWDHRDRRWDRGGRERGTGGQPPVWGGPAGTGDRASVERTREKVRPSEDRAGRRRGF